MKTPTRRRLVAGRLQLPDGREAALLFLEMMASKEAERPRPLTRAKVSETSLKQLFLRHQLTPAFLREVNEWLLGADWALLFAGSTYAAVRVSAVENWPRISWTRVEPIVKAAARGEFDFKPLEKLLEGVTHATGDGKQDDDKQDDDVEGGE